MCGSPPFSSGVGAEVMAAARRSLIAPYVTWRQAVALLNLIQLGSSQYVLVNNPLHVLIVSIQLVCAWP